MDISTLRLRDLRSAVAVVPQEPVLLPGSLRENLDPRRAFTDADIEAVLDKVGLADRFLRLPDGLDRTVAGGGAQFSAGERQLLCVARALLDQVRIVLIDEATSNLDAETDARIQRILAGELAGTTVLTIAHRRDTLADADRVVTLDAGRVVTVTAGGSGALVGEGTR